MLNFMKDRHKYDAEKNQRDRELGIVEEVLSAIGETTYQCMDDRQLLFHKLRCAIPKIKEIMTRDDIDKGMSAGLYQENLVLTKRNAWLKSQLNYLNKCNHEDEIKKQEFLNKYRDYSAEKLKRCIELSDAYIESCRKCAETECDGEIISWNWHEIKTAKLRKKVFEELLGAQTTSVEDIDTEKDSLKAEIDRLQNRISELEDQNYKLSYELT
jgi:cell division protein FtsB